MTADVHVDLRVDLDVAVRRGWCEARLHARHELTGSTVRAVASAGRRVEDTRFGVRDWGAELARACRVPIPDDAGDPAPDGAALPWDLVVGTGAALAGQRRDVSDELVARADAGLHEPLRRLHRAVGRLRAVGTVPLSRRIGWVAWMLFADGWCALTPYVDPGPCGPRPMIRLEHRDPEDLVHEVARWAAEVSR